MLGGGTLLWLLVDRHHARKAARDAEEQLALADLGVRIQSGRDPVPIPAGPATPAGTASPGAVRPEPGRDHVARLAPRTFDPLFALHGHGLPVPYLRTLAMFESDMKPRQLERRSSAAGLLQVVDVVRVGFNSRHGTAYERRDLLDPAINIQVASDLLARIAAGYERYHPDVPNLRTDWTNPRFVELLTFGWNAGFSERAGVGSVVAALTARGQHDVTIDDVFRAARSAGASDNLSNPRKLQWTKRVAAQHLREMARDDADGYAAAALATAPPPPAPAPAPITSPDQVEAAQGGA
ncbi:MAG: transglycosylase SLT domain-containing protein [Kofleriaceae bacterium]|nr:transglycosylase SLT domain-containing protein [Kofleriaceae bacterium]